MSEMEAVATASSPSEDLDTDSLPEVSVSDQGAARDAWLSDLDVDDSRWVDGRDEAALGMWGSPTAGQPPPPPFDPATAFIAPESEEVEDSDSNRSYDGWQSKRGEVAAPKRQKLSETIGHPPSTSETVMTATTGTEAHDDEERSSGDYQGADLDEVEDVIRALGPSNVRQLASMPSAQLRGLEGASDSEGADDASERSYGDTSDLDSSEGSDGPLTFCVNCTNELDPMQTQCPSCGHDATEDASLFSSVRSQRQAEQQRRLQPRGTILAYDDRLTAHEEGKRCPHPERPDRIKAVIARLMTTGLADRCLRVPCREATAQELLACHTGELVTKVQELANAASFSGRETGLDRTYFTSDTYVRPSTFRCASLAAGGCVEVATAVARGEAAHGAAIVRPPGHHAESGMAMGFCFFNNAAVAARAAQRAGAKRVLIFDWDVHHGNGTQHIFESDPSVLYMSIHRWDGGYFFPGTGGPSEVGKGPGEGFTVNVPWPCGGMGNGDYLAALNHVILPIAYQFAPAVIIVSAGFDAAAGDPLGGCRVTPEGFAHMTALLANVAPLAVLLEGGYNLTSTALGTEASLRVLLGERPPPLPNAGVVNSFAAAAIQKTARKQAKYWRCLRPFVEHLSFDPYTSPFADAENAPSTPISPSGSRPDGASPRKSAGSGEALVLKAGQPLSTSSHDVARAISRSKIAARRTQGKSQRRLQYMHALHLVALRHRLKAAKAVSDRLAVRPSLQKLASDAHTLPSPTRRHSLKTPFEAHRPQPLAENTGHHHTAV